MTPDETTLLEAIQRRNRALCQALFPFATASDHMKITSPDTMVELLIDGVRVTTLKVSHFRYAAQHIGWLATEDDDVRPTP